MTEDGKELALSFERAMSLLSKPGYKLVQTNTKQGQEFSVVPGGRVTDTTARRLLDHWACHELDRGLFSTAPQSWSSCLDDDEEDEDWEHTLHSRIVP